ncbi:unnamed protein product [Symbiodinium sp. CCMP2592]|nr:unnamed protein product [Symbiodinium sp. CCMP2592]
MSGISPPSEDRSRSRTSGESSFSDPELCSGQAFVPAAATILRIREPAPTPQRNEGYSSSSAASPPQRGPELSATQATFLAGAAVTHAHHASGVALGAASLAHQAAEREQQTVTQAREAVMQASFQAAAAEAQYRDEAQSIARAAQGIVDDARFREASLRQEAQSAIDATTREAQQRGFIRSSPASHFGTRAGCDADIVRLADEMESMQRRHEEAMAVMAERYRDLSAKFVESSNAQAQRTPTRTRLSFPEMSFSPDTSQNDAVQQPTTPVIEPVPEEQETLSTPLVAQPTGESDAPQEGAAAGAPGGEASSGSPEDPQPTSVDQRVDELAKLVSDLAKLVAASAAQSGSAAAPSGAAPSAPAEAQSDPPPQVPTLNLGGTTQATAPPGSPGSGGSSSSSSSSDSSARSEHPACRMCGSKKHAEEECPELTCNKDGGDDPAPDGDGAAASSAAAPKTNAELEEETIRVKSLSDLSFPNPPQNAAQARGFVNQTLMAIGKLQKTPGDEVYIWAQDCLKKEPAALCKDGRFPRLDREIAAKLIKVCRHGRFGLLFQQMVESERLKSGGMPNGRCMLRAIYSHFQLERDRMGMLAERNLLNIRIGGDGISHLEAFRDKYHYVANTIPVEDLPKDSTIFNHLIDEFEKVSVLKPKVEKAREARPGSHRRTAAWLWNRVDIAIDLHQQRVNRQEFDKSLQQKPETLTSTSQPSKPSVPATPAPGQERQEHDPGGEGQDTVYVLGVRRLQRRPLSLNQDGKITWLWDTAAGRHLIGRQALSSKALSCVTRSETPVGFATGGGAREGTHSLAFEGSRLLPSEEQVYVLKECPPAFSVGKAVLDEGSLFVWDPREHRPYFVKKEDVHRCKLRIPRKARINATRVVEYVPQFEETLRPAAEASYPRTTSGDYDWEADVVEKHAEKKAEAKRLFREGAVGETAASESSEEEPFPELFKGKPASTQQPAEGTAAKEAASGASSSREGAAPSAPSTEQPPPLPPPPEPYSKTEELRAEATSEKHLRTHFPKNPFCKICHIAKTTSMRVAHKPDAKADDMIDVPPAPFQQLATDDVIMAKGDEHRGIGTGGVKSHHVVRDVFSGARVAYPMTRRGAPQHARNFRHFIGLRANEMSPTCLIKLDEAGELIVAAEEVGLTPEPSLPNRWPHNALLERDIREEKECCRAIHLQSGLPYDMHSYSYPYACLSLSFDRTAPLGGVTQWEALTKEPFSGKRACFGQLVWYRSKGSKRTLEPNMSPGLFLGWRIDAGMRYRNVVKVLDYNDFRGKRNTSVHDVPEPELYIEDGPPIFPVANATRKALVDGSTLSAASGALPEIPLREIPFALESIGPPAPRTPGVRTVYITADRIVKFGETPGCLACRGKATKHTDTCRARFAELVKADKEEAAARRAALRALGESPETPAPSVAPETPFPSTAPETPAPSVAPSTPVPPASATVSVVSAGAALPPCTASATCLLDTVRGKENLPVFGLAAPSIGEDKPQKRGNKRRRVNEELGVPHVRLAKETLDVENELVAAQLHEQFSACPKSRLWVSLPCTSGCQWHRVQLKRGGGEYRARLLQKIHRSKKLFAQFAEHAKTALDLGIDVTFEWPRYSDSWKRPDVKEFFKDPRFKVVDFDGCMLGVSASGGQPVKKPWRLMTTSASIVSAFEGITCNHDPSEHVEARGKDLELTGLYTQEMCERIAFAINPSRAYISVPAMPILPTSTTTEHREKEQELKHVSALSGYEDLAAVIESDQEASKLVEEVVDLSALMCAVHSIPKEAPSKEVSAMVTKLLSRAEMLSSPEALNAVKQEADGLRAVPVWDETNPQEYASVQAQARRTGTKVHFGKLMSIASIKFWELAKHLQKVKGRIVYRGDCAKDEEGAAAVYRELGANPTSVQGLNACLAYGSLPGHQSSAADAVKAYVQALLKSKYQTWIELPPELRPAWWRECFAKPVVLLLRALYGHPEAGGLWEKHLKGVLKSMGGQELPEYPGNFWFPETKLLLSTYVDDLTLSGPQEEHQPFWDALCKVVDVEPPEPVYRILGRNHCTINAEPEGTENAALGALKGAMAFDMFDYTQQTVDLYKGLTGLKALKHAATPFAPEASLPVSQEEIAGELAPNACDLATKVQKWSRNDDKKLLRLISYIDSTKTHRLVGAVSDGPRELHLALYVDADFAGERDDAKSTSGGFLVLKGPNTFFPLAWVSKLLSFLIHGDQSGPRELRVSGCPKLLFSSLVG